MRKSHDDFVADQQDRVRSACDTDRESLRLCAENRKKHDWGVGKEEIKPGTVCYYYPRYRMVMSPKWARHNMGPMLGTRVLSPTNNVI